MATPTTENLDRQKNGRSGCLLSNSLLYLVRIGWLRMSGRRTSGTSRPSLGVQVLAVFSFISWGKSQSQEGLGKRLEVPDVLLPDIRRLLKGDRIFLTRPFLTQISGRNFLPNFVERSTLKNCLSKICAVPFALQNRALFEGENRAKGVQKRGGRGVASRGGKKEKNYA